MPRSVLAFASLLSFALLTGACASTGAVPKPFPSPGGTIDASRPEAGRLGSETGGAEGAAVDSEAVVSLALALRGTPYRTGGTDPDSGFDCSGFTQYVFAQQGLALPREVRDQYRAGTPVKPQDVAAGDLLFFTTTAPGPTHVGIALGDDAFIHAPSSTGVVRVERLSGSYWSRRFLQARRIN